MATESGLKQLVGGNSWDFPRFDDQTGGQEILQPRPPHHASRKAKVALSAVIGLSIVGLAVSAIGVVAKSSGVSQSLSASSGQANSGKALDSAGAIPLVVHISGAVMSPGLVKLPEGARVNDAIVAAGGLSLEAAEGALNLARFVVDGEHIVVPVAGEILDDSASSAGLVSLSLASASELESLSGVGPALAQRIISWREEHGPFRQVEDILAVSGIGPATLEGFRNQVVP
jgi:competence protein ComEA